MNKFWGTSRDYSETEPSTLPMVPPGDEAAYADTEPQALANVRPVVESLSLAPLEVTLYDLMAEIRKDNRVCPQPTRWLAFYRMLEEAAGPGVKLPSPPLVGSAWAATPSLAKRMCFREQVEWTASHRLMNMAHQFLKSLKESDWHYMG